MNSPLCVEGGELDDVRLCWADVEALSSSKTEQMLAVLSPSEKERYRRFRHQPSRQCHLITRHLVRHCLSELGDSGPATWRFGVRRWGRPFLENPTEQLEQLDFNIAHSRFKTVVAISFRGRIGVDLEPVQRRVDSDLVAEKFFHISEKKQLRGLDGQPRRLRFLQLWVLKEAWMKADGRGIGAGLSEVVFHFDDAGNPSLVSVPNGDVEPWKIELRRVDDHLLGLAWNPVATRKR